MTPQIFISYSHKDEAWMERIQAHLKVLVEEGRLSLWVDTQIEAGEDWLPAIEQAMASCRVALLLVSADYLSSPFILKNEIPKLMKRRSAEGVRVVPLILRPCPWKSVPWLQAMMLRPKDGKALSGMSEYDAEEAIATLVEEIAKLLVAKPPHPGAGKVGPVAPPTDTTLPEARSASLGLRETAFKLQTSADNPPPPNPQDASLGLHGSTLLKLAFAITGIAVVLVALMWKPEVALLEQQTSQSPGPGPVPAEPAKPISAKVDFGIEMVKIPAMKVFVGKYEVTQGQWKKVMGDNPSHFFSCGDSCPIENISWENTQKFINKLNYLTGKHYRLPTRIEWESICLAGENKSYCGSNYIDEIAWYRTNSNSRPHSVGSKAPNAFGVYDMTGNVMEYTFDNNECCESHGGAWFNDLRYMHHSNIDYKDSKYHDSGHGFRILYDE